MSDTSNASNRTLTLERTLNAPVQLVWEAWTQADHIVRWWGPKGMKTRIVEHDFKVGGNWKYVMAMPDGSDFIADGQYLEIVQFTRLCSSANFKPMTEGVEIQAFFEAQGEKTHFIFNVVHPTEEYCKQQEQMGSMNGWGSVFDRLEDFLNNH